MKQYYYTLYDYNSTKMLYISTLPNQLDENDSTDMTSTLGKYLFTNQIYEACESIFEVPTTFDENKFIHDLQSLGINMSKGNFW